MFNSLGTVLRQLFLCFAFLTLFSGSAHALILGSFDFARGGQSSFDGSFSILEPIIDSGFPGTSYTTTSILSDSFLSGIDILMLASVKNGAFPGQTAVSPLTTDEQSAMLSFVNAGGGVFVLVDNVDFSASNNSFISPFGLSVAGALSGAKQATVTNPADHPVTNGPFGLILEYETAFPGLFTTLGANATSLATISGSDVLAVIDHNILSPTSGGVVLSSDYSIIDSRILDPTLQNDELVLNVIDFLSPKISVPTPSVPEPATLTLMGLGLAGIGYRRRQLMKA